MAVTKSADGPGGVVILQYEDLCNETCDLTEAIEEAYGPDGLGILVVRGVPEFEDKRKTLLPLGQKFAMLPEETKNKTVHEASHYSFGWSHGKEMLSPGQVDTFKGSYYANPQYDRPIDDEALIKEHPAYCHPNIWPSEDLPELQPAFKDLGQLIVKVGHLVGKHTDKYVQKKYPNIAENGSKAENISLAQTIERSKACKARLLNYFPRVAPVGETPPLDSWCGWHLDHGSLTGLTCAMYLDEAGNQVANPDPENAGLYIRDRAGNLHRAKIPLDCIAYQMGESTQVRTGGTVRATPHCVRAAYSLPEQPIHRATFAVFMQPSHDEPLDVPATISDEGRAGISADIPSWKEGQDFNAFTQETLKKYYGDSS